MNCGRLTVAAVLSVSVSFPVHAGEVWVGAYVHDVDTPFSRSGIERGSDVHVGWRGDRIEGLRIIGRPAPYVFASANTAGDTNFAAAGLGWRIGQAIYVRPGIGIAVHDAPSTPGTGSGRIDFGSRVLFAPEAAVGWQASPGLSIEASWVHLSHARLFGGQNPGIDNFGLRLVYRLR